MKGEIVMTNDEKDKIALFKYAIIAPLISNTYDSANKNDFFIIASQKKYRYIDGKLISLSYSTIERWYYNYINKGFDALKPKLRSDVGTNRKLDDELMAIINHYVDKHPRLPATSIREDLIKNGYITSNEVSLSTITRYVQSYKKNNKIVTKTEMRRYELEHINDVWCCDTSYSFKLSVDGVLKRTFIIAIIDDASRLVVGCDVFFNDNYANYMSVLKQAVKRYGKPKLLNVDNGTPYKNGQIELLCARLGIVLHHCAPYSPEQKSKIERWFRTMKDHFMATYHISNKTTIESYKTDLLEYVNNYNNSVHSSLNGKTPNERFFNCDDHIIRLDDNIIDTSFLIEVDRTVSADGIILLDKKAFEVPYLYANKRIKIRYSTDYSNVYIINPDNTLTKITILDKIANSKIKRAKPQFYIKGDE